jgi:DNA modification methylase
MSDKPTITLHNCDCLDFMRTMPDKSVDLCLTDPPYGLDIANNPFRQAHEKSNWDESPCSDEQLAEMIRVSKEQVVWGGNYFNLPPTQCFFVWDKLQPEDFSSAMCEMAWVSRQSPAKMFKKWVVNYKKFHPTQKPDDLMVWCLERFPDSQTIFDPFMGSGTTGVACKLLRRNFIGCEIDKKYFDLAQRRINSTEFGMFD